MFLQVGQYSQITIPAEEGSIIKQLRSTRDGKEFLSRLLLSKCRGQGCSTFLNCFKKSFFYSEYFYLPKFTRTIKFISVVVRIQTNSHINHKYINKLQQSKLPIMYFFQVYCKCFCRNSYLSIMENNTLKELLLIFHMLTENKCLS